ncbi:hypothetical protein [Mucilaginibacter segetis]|uniref:Outer membrane protein beta-barrel domain-containing protein n=1 Tax=Mucilaginibacter segetis TaxID=2793071 RepID=A0A934PW11_9SPHI|nr:hypothetical protein [Mucilaginibacter segetis]MBK0380165.1 hypothetical protein [Mucilaginibacter segetis]
MLKKYILIIVILITTYKVEAQGYNFNDFGIGVEASRVKSFADLKNAYENNAYSVSLIFNYSPYVPVALEFQSGKLTGGGNTIEEDAATRRYSNKYKAAILHFDIQLGELMDYSGGGIANIFKHFYFGSGIGGIYNNVDANRVSMLDPNYKFPGDDKSVNLMIPFRVGYEIKIYDYNDFPRFGIDIGYRHNITFGEGLDGYTDPSSKFKNNAPDQYRQISIGLKYNFGTESSYYKSIRSF